MSRASLIVVWLGAGCATGTVAGKPTCETGVPFVANDQVWSSYDGRSTVDCRYTACFPKDVAGVLPCDPRCLLTTAGHGTPEAVTRAFAGKVAQERTPRFIVAYGPPASGKSRILPVLEKELATEVGALDPHTVSVNVDDVFQGGEVGRLYKQYRVKLVEQSPTDKRTLYTQRLYALLRWSADQIADAILNQALAGRFNVLWETTGASTWPRHELGRLGSYGLDTLVVYPLVATDQLVERAARRAVEEGQEGAPPEQIRSAVVAAQANLVDLLPANAAIQREPCPAEERFGRDADGCRAKRVILLDNTGARGDERIAFDSQAPEARCAALAALDAKVSLQPTLREALYSLAPRCRP